MNNSFQEAAKLLKLKPETIFELETPQRLIEVNFPIEMDSGEKRIFNGYRVQHNNFRGPYKGGIRFHHEVDKEEVKLLAFLMSMKTSLLNLPFGGSKGGVAVDPKSLSEKELEKLSKGYVSAIASDIGPYLDVPAPDVNTNPKIMDWMVEEYKKISEKEESLAAFTGKSLGKGGSYGRDEATGFGGFVVLREALGVLGMGKPLKVAIQGFGNVGAHIADLLYQEGYEVIALSDSRGGIYSEGEGFAVDLVKECKEEKGTLAGCYFVGSVTDAQEKIPEGGSISNEELLGLNVDILVPAALGGVITKDNVSKIKAKIILEMANGPVTPEADEILEKNGVVVIPDILANAGGVTASYFEWYQNINKEKWGKEEVLNKLTEKMALAFRKVWKTKEEFSTSLRTASYVAALEGLLEKNL